MFAELYEHWNFYWTQILRVIIKRVAAICLEIEEIGGNWGKKIVGEEILNPKSGGRRVDPLIFGEWMTLGLGRSGL